MNTSTEAGSEGVRIVSLMTIALAVANRLRLIALLAAGGMFAGLVVGLLSTRLYVSGALLVPQSSEGPSSGIALAASQFGIRVPTGDGAWSLGLYAEVLRSRALLEPLATADFGAVDVSGGTARLSDLLEVDEADSLRRIAKTIERLRRTMSVAEDEDLGAVRISVRTKWRSVSYRLADSLVQGLNRFNVLLRQSQARSERIFLEERQSQARTSLRAAEDRLQRFLQANRTVISSAELSFERDRLQRQVGFEQQVVQGLAQSLEEARIREVRSVPPITAIESPQPALIAEARGTPLKMVVGLFLGVVLGILVVVYDLRVAESTPESAQDWSKLKAAIRESMRMRKPRQ